MKTLNQYIQEKLIVNKDYRDAGLSPKSFKELRKIIEQRYKEKGPGTKRNPIDFNDIDVSNIRSFCDNKYNSNVKGIFEYMRFKYIDISDWDVSNIESMRHMFYRCTELKSVGDISNWNVSNVTNMHCMFYYCKNFNQDISNWDVSNIIKMPYMFYGCEKFDHDLSNWKVSGVQDMEYMFAGCKKFNQDLSDWDVSNVMYKSCVFVDCPIKDKYKPKFK